MSKQYVAQLEADIKKHKQDKTAAEAVATLADERMKAAYAAKDEVAAEKASVSERFAVLSVEKGALEEQLQKVERRLQSENAALQTYVHNQPRAFAALGPHATSESAAHPLFAPPLSAEVCGQCLACERKSASTRTCADGRIGAHYRIQNQCARACTAYGCSLFLGVPASDGVRGGAGGRSSVLQAQERCKQLQQELEKANGERCVVEAQLAVAASERRGADEASRRMEQLLARLQQDFPALQARCDAAEEQSKEMRSARDAAVDDLAALRREMAVAVAEKGGAADLARKAEEEMGRLEAARTALNERLESALARQRESEHAKEAANGERTRTLQQLAVVSAEKATSDEGCNRLQGQLREERTRCEAAEAAGREATRARDHATEEKSRLEGQLSVMIVEKRELELKVGSLEKALSLGQEERSAMQLRAEGAEARLRDSEGGREAAVAERQRVEQEMAVATAERRRVDEAAARAEAHIKECVTAALSRSRPQSQPPSVAAAPPSVAAAPPLGPPHPPPTPTQADRARIPRWPCAHVSLAHAPHLRLCSAKPRHLPLLPPPQIERPTDIAAHAPAPLAPCPTPQIRPNRRLQKDKQTLHARAEAAEARVRDVLSMRDGVVDERTRATESLAATTAEKTALEEAMRRCELQLKTLTEDKAALTSRAEAAEERSKELARQRDAAQNERSKLAEQLGVSHTERRAVEEVLRVSETRSGEERSPLLQRAEFCERRCNEMEGQRDALAKERQQLAEQLTSTRDALAEAQRELASSASERHTLEELLHRTEARLGDERASLRAAVDGAEGRCAEVSRQRDAALDERIRAAEVRAHSGEGGSACNAARRKREEAPPCSRAHPGENSALQPRPPRRKLRPPPSARQPRRPLPRPLTASRRSHRIAPLSPHGARGALGGLRRRRGRPRPSGAPPRRRWCD